MKWLAANGTTLVMALILSLVTVGLLSEPSANRTQRTLVRFSPEIRDELRLVVGSLRFLVDGAPVADYVPVTVSGDEADVTAALQNLICRPVLDRSKLPEDQNLRKTQVEISLKDFNLPADLAEKISIKSFVLTVEFAPMMEKVLPLEVSPNDIAEDEGSRYRVESVRALPPSIRVRLPVDMVGSITSLPIKPIDIRGRTKNFEVLGHLNTEHSYLRDVRKLEDFQIAVDLKLIEVEDTVEGLALSLSAPLIPGHRAELTEPLMFKVVIRGPKDLVKALKDRPELIHVYVRLEGKNWKPGPNQLGVRCEVPEEFRDMVQIELAPGEAPIATVQVTRI